MLVASIILGGGWAAGKLISAGFNAHRATFGMLAWHPGSSSYSMLLEKEHGLLAEFEAERAELDERAANTYLSISPETPKRLAKKILKLTQKIELLRDRGTKAYSSWRRSGEQWSELGKKAEQYKIAAERAARNAWKEAS